MNTAFVLSHNQVALLIPSLLLSPTHTAPPASVYAIPAMSSTNLQTVQISSFTLHLSAHWSFTSLRINNRP